MSEFVEIGALWAGREGSKAIMSGKLGNANLLIFKNDKKEAGSKQPDYRVVVASGYKKEEESSQIDF